MATSTEWLELLPKPFPLAAGKKWHVFLSYRSVHRSWVIQLYDILTQLGYVVFLDQYVLSANHDLVMTLSEALECSQSGVLIWSKEAADSEWCKTEFSSMSSREKSDKSFHFVLTRLDSIEFPGFARGKLYQDFSDCREGPRGAGLLRLIFGLHGKPLNDQAVKFAETVDQDTRDSLASIMGAKENGDADELIRLSKSDSPAWKGSALLSCLVAETLIGMQQYQSALDVLAPVQAAFPRSIRPKQLKGLAIRRLGDWQAAQAELAKLKAAGETDPETLGIYAATWMDRYKADGNELHLRKSRDLYAQAFLSAPQDYYVGINAASKSVMLGELEVGKKYADQVEQIVGSQAKMGDYWMTATIAEVQLLQGNYARAAELYQAAVAMDPAAKGSHDSTWKQAGFLMDKLQTPAEDRDRIRQVFKHLLPQDPAAH